MGLGCAFVVEYPKGSIPNTMYTYKKVTMAFLFLYYLIHIDVISWNHIFTYMLHSEKAATDYMQAMLIDMTIPSVIYKICINAFTLYSSNK